MVRVGDTVTRANPTEHRRWVVQKLIKNPYLGRIQFALIVPLDANSELCPELWGFAYVETLTKVDRHAN